MQCRLSSDAARVELYDGMLGVLREGGGGGKGDFGKEMWVWREEPPAVRCTASALRFRDGAVQECESVRDLGMAWGGRMVVNGMVEWVDGVYVGNCAGWNRI